MIGARFSGAFEVAARVANSASQRTKVPIRLIRDLYGRVSFFVEAERQDFPVDALAELSAAKERMSNFASPSLVVFQDDFYSLDTVLRDPAWEPVVFDDESGATVLLLERQSVGEDWSRREESLRAAPISPRIVFFSIKGGVGRSTALSVLANQLADKGKRVLLIDLDLESPGLSSLLLPTYELPEFGVVDWLIEEGISGAASEMLTDMVSYSPLSDFVRGTIRVAAAAGASDGSYLSKLVRIYSGGPPGPGRNRLADKLLKLVGELEHQEKPDVTLIDSRGGLHDLAAVSLGHIADLGLLFCTDSQQSWDGYRHLFEYWRQRPSTSKAIRERLKIVHAFFPETEQVLRTASFRRKSWDLFRDTLYDETPGGAESAAGFDAFTFDENDDEAPHMPLTIRWDRRFVEYDPRITPENGGMTQEDIRITFGAFVERIESWLEDLPSMGAA